MRRDNTRPAMLDASKRPMGDHTRFFVAGWMAVFEYTTQRGTRVLEMRPRPHHGGASVRAMSFALTTAQMLAGTKTVTRRLGWKGLRPGTRLRAVEKAMGLRPGEKQRVLRLIEVVDVRVERVDAVTGDDVAREGFPSSGFSTEPEGAPSHRAAALALDAWRCLRLALAAGQPS